MNLYIMESQIKKLLKNKTIFVFCCFLSFSCIVESQPEIPQEWKTLKEELKNRKTTLISSVTNRRFQRISRVMRQKNAEDKALQSIERLENSSKNRPSDLVRVYFLKAQVYSSKDDFKNALLFYQKAMDLKKLSYDEHLSALYNMISIYVFQNQIDKASQLMDQWFYLADKITPPAYILKASILMERNQKAEALKFVMKAIKESGKPAESWLAFAASLHLEMDNYVRAAQILEKLTSSYPDRKKYWTSLSTAYLNINKNSRGVASLDLAYKLDFLNKENEIIHLSGLLFDQGQPLKAARLLDVSLQSGKIKKNQKNYEMLGDCWRSAEEDKPALKAYQQASQYSVDGRIFAKIGFIYLNGENWVETVSHFQKALEKGDIKRPEQIHIQMGVALFNLKKYAESVTSFEQVLAMEIDSQWIKMAREWINHVSEYL